MSSRSPDSPEAVNSPGGPPAASAVERPNPAEKKGGSLVRERLRGRVAQPRRGPAPLIVIAPEQAHLSLLPWRQRLGQSVSGLEGLSFMASAVVHGLLFLFIVLVLYLLGWNLRTDEGRTGPINAIFTEKNVEQSPDLEKVVDVEFDLPIDGARDLAMLDSSANSENARFITETVIDDLSDPSAMLPAMPENPLDLLGEIGGEYGDSRKRGGFAMPKDKDKVITQGSFSVWTVPEDPVPRRFYRIVIQLNRRVKIPNLQTDVTGSVTGSDGYYTEIGFPPKRFQAPQFVIRKARQVVIKIPPPKPGLEKSGIRDKIEVHSKTLNETQKIEIVF